MEIRDFFSGMVLTELTKILIAGFLRVFRELPDRKNACFNNFRSIYKNFLHNNRDDHGYKFRLKALVLEQSFSKFDKTNVIARG